MFGTWKCQETYPSPNWIPKTMGHLQKPVCSTAEHHDNLPVIRCRSKKCTRRTIITDGTFDGFPDIVAGGQNFRQKEDTEKWTRRLDVPTLANNWRKARTSSKRILEIEMWIKLFYRDNMAGFRSIFPPLRMIRCPSGIQRVVWERLAGFQWAQICKGKCAAVQEENHGQNE